MIYADILFFAVVAAFLVLKLRRTLGKKDGTEERLRERMQKMQQEMSQQFHQAEAEIRTQVDKNVVEAEAVELPVKDEKVAKKLEEISQKDSRLDVSEFVKGAQRAFEMVVDAFNQQDKDVLRHLLAPDVFQQFEAEIDRLEKQGNQVQTTIVSMEPPLILSASLRGKRVQIEVEFVTEQINVVRDKDDKVVEGNASEVDEVREDWVFERQMDASSPAWMVVAT